MSSSDERFENMMKEAIAPNIEPDKSLNEKIITGAFEPKKAKVSSLPRLIAVAAIVVALGSAGVYAGVQIHKKLINVKVDDNKILVGNESEESEECEESEIISEGDGIGEPLVVENRGTDEFASYDSYDEAIEKSGVGLVFSETYQLKGTAEVSKYGVGGDYPCYWMEAELLYKGGSFVEEYNIFYGFFFDSGELPFTNAHNERVYVAPNDFEYTLVDCDSSTYVDGEYINEQGTAVAIFYNYHCDTPDGMQLCTVGSHLFFKNLSDEDIYHVLDTLVLPEEASREEDIYDVIDIDDGSVSYESYEEAREQTGLGVDFSEDYEQLLDVSYYVMDDQDSLYAKFSYKNGSFTETFALMKEWPDIQGSLEGESVQKYVSKNGNEYKIWDSEGITKAIIFYEEESIGCMFSFEGLSEDEIHHVLDTVIVP